MEVRSKEVQRWLELSADCPLSMTITMPAGRHHDSHPPLVDAIIQSSQCWQQLELGDFDYKSDVQWLKKMCQCLHDLERSAWCNLLT